MQKHQSIFPLLLLFPILALCATIQPPTLSAPPPLIPPRIECNERYGLPRNPTPQACQQFLYRLSLEARKEPPGAYQWFGRHLEACDECVRLPAMISYGSYLCAAYIDVDDENEQDLSIFGLKDLFRALQGVKTQCWTQQIRNGRGFPDRQSTWAIFTKGADPQGKNLGNETLGFGGRTMNFIDLSEGWNKTERKSGGDTGATRGHGNSRVLAFA
ncbi:MAG: hypothetical protein Q9166_001807 [cf. Caloplaca sp. 2 TL-2023]